MSATPTQVVDFDSLTESQQRVLGCIAVGLDGGHARQTVRSLLAKELIDTYREVAEGLTVVRYFVPIWVHIQWCAWCARRSEKRWKRAK